MLEFLDLPYKIPLLAFSLGITFLYTLYCAVWRLYFSPIAHFPGPWFAALTFWNEFYYDVVLGGRYTWKIREYHERYGPIIRINPFEIHINDPNFYDEVYVTASRGKTDKWAWSMRMFGQVDTSAFETLNHDQHRVRRAPWNPYFSKQSISRIQPLLIQTAVNKLCDRLADHQEAGKPVIMTNAFACLTTDIISEYAFPDGYDLLSRPEFDEEHYNAWIALSRVSHLMKQFGWLYPLLDSIPEWVTKYTSPDFYVVIRQKKYLLEQAKLIIKQRKKADYNEKTLRPSLLRSLLDSDLLPDSQKQPERIRAEAQVAMGAGTLTTSHGLKHATYFILADKDVHARLMAELKASIPDLDNPPVLRELEQMPYLVAVMYETLRIFYGISHRLSRIFPDRSLQYKSWTIPPGIPMSMTSVLIHDNAAIFPEPYSFKPERWLPLQTTGQHLLKYLVPFGGGSRQCVGMELGKAEILTALASVFRRFGDVIELWETRRDRDVDIAHDLFNPVSSQEGNGVMVMFQKPDETGKFS